MRHSILMNQNACLPMLSVAVQSLHRPPFQNHPLTHFSQEQRVHVRKIEPAPATLLVSVSPQMKPKMKPRRLL
jgi:hypothetical protein